MSTRLQGICWLFLAGTLAVWAAVELKPGKDGSMILENDLLRMEISPVGARIISLYDKLQERENVKNLPYVGGMNEVRFRNTLNLNDLSSEYTLAAGEQTETSATVIARHEVVPTEERPYAAIVTKTYTLHQRASAIAIAFTLENRGSQDIALIPWLRNLLLRGTKEQPDEAIMLPHGVFKLGEPVPGRPGLGPRYDWHHFPAANWTTRVVLPLEDGSNTLGLVLRPEDMLKTYNWHRDKEDFCTMEVIAAPLFLEPGETESWPYHLILTSPVRNIVYASPDLVIGANPHPTGIEAATNQLDLTFASTHPLPPLRVRASLKPLPNGDSIDLGDWPLHGLTPGVLRQHALAVSLTDQATYQLELSFSQDGEAWHPGARAGDNLPVIIPLTVGTPHPQNPVYPDRTPDGGRLRTIQPRQIEAPLVAKNDMLQVFSRDAGLRVFPEDSFAAGEPEPVQLFACRNEYEPLQLVLAPQDGTARQLPVVAEPLTGPDGSQVPCESVNTFLYAPTRMPSHYNARYPVGTYPEALLPTAQLALNGQTNLPLFLIYQVPVDAAPGRYTGTVRIGDLTVPVTLTVWAVTLPTRSPWMDTPSSLKGLSTGGVVMRNEQGEEMDRGEILRAVEDAHFKHRMTPCDSGFHQALWALKFDAFEADMQRYVDAGATKIYLGSIPSILKNYHEQLPQVEAYLAEKGWQDYFYVRPGFDEASIDLVEKVAEVCRQWDAVSDIPIMETYYHDQAEPLFGLMDIYCRGGVEAPEWVAERQAAGDEFWKVNAFPNTLEPEPWTIRGRYWDMWDKRFTGTYIWTLKQWHNVAEWGNDYWCDGGVGNLSAVLMWPHETGVLTTIRLVAMRDAVEDNALLWMLRERVEALKDQPHPAVQNAKVFLSKTPILPALDSPAAIKALRQDAGNALSALNTAYPE